MAYSQGGLIAASDYNGFVGSNNTTSGTLNYVWSTGNGSYGYGQTGIAAVSQSGLVTAAQWASLINTMNSVSTHQSGSGSGLSAPTAGSTVNYLSTVSSGISTYNTNHLNAATQGTTTTGSTFSPTITATQGATYGLTTFATRTVTFASADSARYFFNAGGQLNLVIISVANNDSTSRSADAVSTIGTYFAGMSAFKAATNGQRTGSGGTLAGGGYTSGYYSLTTSAQTIAQVTTSSSTYSTDYFLLNVLSNGVQGSNADKGTVITFNLQYYSSHPGSFNDTLNVTVNHRIDVVYPETTNLSNSWGTVTIA